MLSPMRPRLPHSTRACQLPLLVGLCASAPGVAQEGAPVVEAPRPAERPDADRERARELLTFADARADDWETEKLELSALARLNSLGEVLLEWLDGERGTLDLDEFFESGLVVLVPSGDPIEARPGPLRALVVEGGGGEASPADEEFEELLGALDGGDDPRLAFKITSVEVLHSDSGERTLRTEVRMQASAEKRSEGAREQVDVTWAVDWTFGSHGDPLRISMIFPKRYSMARNQLAVDEGSSSRARPSTGPVFRDLGGEWLTTAGGRAALLAGGAPDWSSRLDNLGEPHLFGHNGLAVGDADGDGREDLFVATGNGLPNMLFVRGADGAWRERGLEAGIAWLDDSKGALFLDGDNDGDQDLVVAVGPALIVHRNEGRGRFRPVASLRTRSDAPFYSLAAADYDLDGDLDLYATRYVETTYGDSIPMPLHDATNGPRNHLLRNEGQLQFSDVTDSSGLGEGNNRFSSAAGWADVDRDGDPDLYVSNDFGRNQLFRNDGGTFVNVASELAVEDQAAGMGVDFGDVDGDGDLDLLVSNMFSSAGRRITTQGRFQPQSPGDVRAGLARHALGNSLFLAEPEGAWTDASDSSGLRMGRWAWGARLIDFNNDGRLDVLVPNGFVTGTEPDDL